MMPARYARSAVPKDKDYLAARREAPRMMVPNHPERPQIELAGMFPMPEEKRGGLRKYDHYYPFEDMLPGQSFWVPSDTQCTSGAMSKFAKKSGWKFKARGQGQDGRPNKDINNKKLRGTRVWRIA